MLLFMIYFLIFKLFLTQLDITERILIVFWDFATC